MSERAPYSRIYWSVMDDAKFDGIREDCRLFGAWSLLLIVADMAHPAPAYLPRTVPASAIKRLVDAGLVVLLDGHRYRIHGLDAERKRRRDAATNKGPNGNRTVPERDPHGEQAKQSRDEQRVDEDEVETRLDEDEQRARASDDLWSDPEWEALRWLQRHGCDVRPGNGYHRHLITAVERHGVIAVIGSLDRMAEAGVRNGDIKGLLFGAIDALDAQARPNLVELGKADRHDEQDRAHQARLERTRRETAELRAHLLEEADVSA